MIAQLPAEHNLSPRYLAEAQAQIAERRLDSAAALLQLAFRTARYAGDTFHVLIWDGVLAHLEGRNQVARLRFRQAIDLHTGLDIIGIDEISPRLDEILDQETRARVVFRGGSLDEPPRWLGGPALVHPRLLRHVAGAALLQAVVDTLGRVEPRSVTVLDSPDSGFAGPLERMLLAQRFAPGRRRGRPVRSVASVTLRLEPPARAPPAWLAREARAQLDAGRADSALALIIEALDPYNRPSEAERVLAWLVEGLIRRRLGQEAPAREAFARGLAGYDDLRARGVDLAPFLQRLADSVRMRQRYTVRDEL